MDTKQIAVLAVIIAVSFAGGFAVATVAHQDPDKPIDYVIENTGDYFIGDVKFKVSFLAEEYGYMTATIKGNIVPLDDDLHHVFIPGTNSYDFSVDHTKFGYKSKYDFLKDIEFLFNDKPGNKYVDFYP